MSEYQGDYYSNSNSPYSPARRNPVISFSASPNTGIIGNPTAVTLTWSAEFGTAFAIPGVGTGLNRTGSAVVPGVIATTNWTFNVTKLDGTVIPTVATYTAS